MIKKKTYQPRTERGLLHHVLFEWLLLTFLLVGLAYVMQNSRAMVTANDYVYDRLLPLHERKASQDIVIVNIDDASLSELGSWPWPRSTHAELFEQLSLQQPKAVLFDVILTEPSLDITQDQQLGNALKKFHRVAIPVLMVNDGLGHLNSQLPIPLISQNSILGDIALLPDQDGVVRSASLSQTDQNGRTWPLLTTLLLDDAKRQNAIAQGVLRIPFNIPQGSFITFSYKDVLAGAVPAEFLRDKYVLIGANSTGLGDQYPTPISGSFSLMSGIEIHANILDALINDIRIQPIESTWISIAPIVLLLFALLWIRERFHLIAFVSGLLLYAILVCTLLWSYCIWLPPIISIIGMILAYMIWSWRRLAVVLKHIRTELIDLREQTGHLSKLLPDNHQLKSFRPHHLELTLKHAVHLSHFISESLLQLPVAMVLVDASGYVLMHNHLAQQDFQPPINNQSIFTLLHQLALGNNPWIEEARHNMLNLEKQELHTTDHRILALDVKPIHFDDLESVPESSTFWQISWIDLTNERAAQEKHNQLIVYLSHDLRAPQVGILALLELFRAPQSQLTIDELLAKISNKVYRTLNDTKALVQLARAQNSDSYRREETNLISVIYSAVEQTQAQALAKHIKLTIDETINQVFHLTWLNADGALLTRMFINLLTNAVRYSPVHTTIQVSLTVADDHKTVTCHIQDQGEGMNSKQVAQINQLMRSKHYQAISIKHENEPDVAGSMGVGLYMVAAVIQEHNGNILFESSPKGTTVHIELPNIQVDEGE